MIKNKNNFIPLTFDGIFKALFRHKRYLIDFLKDVLKYDIIDLEYLDSYLEKENISTKESFLDVLVKFNDGTHAIIEMQNQDKGSMVTRIFYYLGKLATKSLKTGEDYKLIKKYIGICVLDYNDSRFTNLHNVCKLYNVNTKEILTDELEIHIINLKSKIMNDKLKWLEVFKEKDDWDMGKYTDEELKAAVNELKRLSGDVEVMAAYDKEMEEKLDRILIRQAGIEEGTKQGAKQAISQAALNFYQNGVNKDIICRSLNITLKELDKILKES